MKKIIYFILKSIRLENFVMLLFHGNGYLRATGWLKTCFNHKSENSLNEPIPWLTYSLIDFIEERVNKEMNILEFGAGNSTIWFSKRAKNVTSIEHDVNWIKQISLKMPDNVTLEHADIGELNSMSYSELTYNYPISNDEYTSKILDTEIKYDIILVDGIFRNKCVEKSLLCLKENGVFIVDNLNYQQQVQPTVDFLEKHNFKLIKFWGLSPIIAIKSCSGIFYRADNCLDI